jgi:phage shock protein C
MNGHRLYRSERDRMLGGVAGGIADYFDLDPSLVRVAWAVLIIASGGLFLLLYIVMWFVVPEAPPGYAGSTPWSATASHTDASAAGAAPAPDAPASTSGPAPSAPMGSPPSSIAGDWSARRAERRRRRSGEGGILVGAVLIVVGIWFLARDYVPWLQVTELWPVALILIGLVLLVGALRRDTP